MRSGKLVAGRFLLQEKLGGGPSGQSFQAVDQRSGQQVVVKLLDPKKALGDRFPKNLRAILKLDEPGLVPALDHGQDEEGWYVVRPWLEGEPLELLLWRGAMPWAEALRLVRAVTSAVAALHRRGLSHLGLSPSNVLVSQGKALVMDAGVGYFEHEAPRLRTRPSLDLQANLAPEQVTTPGAVDERADVFSLGVLLYEALTSKAAFPGAYATAALTRLLCGGVPPLRQLVPDAPDWLDELLGALMARDPAARPVSADAALRLIDRMSDRPATTRRRPGFGAREQRVQGLLMLGGRSVSARPDAAAQAELLCKALVAAGIAPERTPDGLVLGPTAPGGAVPEQLERMALVALGFRKKFPKAPLTLLAGRGELRGRLPEGDLVDRAAATVQGEGRRCTEATVDVRTDALVASLLQGRMQVGGDDHGYLLGAPPRQRAERSGDEEQPAPQAEEEPLDAELAAGLAALEALAPAPRAALKAASIFGGGICWCSSVEAVVEQTIDWKPLRELGLFLRRKPSRFEGETEIEARDPAALRAAYGSLVEDDRREAHRRAAAWLARAGAPPVEIFDHLLRCGDDGEIASFCVKIAQAARDRGDLEEALAWMDRGENAASEGSGALLRAKAELQAQMGLRTGARKTAMRALESTPRGSVEHMALQGLLLECSGLSGDTKRLATVADRLKVMTPGPELLGAWIEALAQGATASLRVGRLELADTLLQKISEAGALAPRARGLLLVARGLRAQIGGYLAASLTLHRAAAQAFREAQRPDLELAARASVASALLGAGALAAAESEASQTLVAARSSGFDEVEARCKVALSVVLQRKAEFELARSTIREATSFFGGRGSKCFEGEARCELVAILLASSDVDAARREAERAQTALAPFPVHQARALALLAQAHLAQGRSIEAAQVIEQARAVAAPLGALFDGAALKPLQAQICQLEGRRDEARQLYLEAEQHLLARAESFDEPALRDSFLRGVPEHARALQLARLLSILPPPGDE